jgi:hypothetical protein
MLAKLLTSIFFICLFSRVFSQTTLIGSWRCAFPNSKYIDTTYKQVKTGDLGIHSDSTFHIEGDSSTQNSAIPGWHVGEECYGTWELQNHNRLFLWLEPKKEKMFFSYMIIKLTREKLVLRSSFHPKDQRYDILYLRY